MLMIERSSSLVPERLGILDARHTCRFGCVHSLTANKQQAARTTWVNVDMRRSQILGSRTDLASLGDGSFASMYPGSYVPTDAAHTLLSFAMPLFRPSLKQILATEVVSGRRLIHSTEQAVGA